MRSGFQPVFSLNNWETASWNATEALQLSWEQRREMIFKEFGKMLCFCTQKLKSGNKNERMKPEPEVEIAE